MQRGARGVNKGRGGGRGGRGGPSASRGGRGGPSSRGRAQPNQQQASNSGGDDAFDAILTPIGGAAGKTSASTSLDAKYIPPPLYPEVEINKKNFRPLREEDHVLLVKYRNMRYRHKHSPYYLRKEKLFDSGVEQRKKLESTNRFGLGLIKLSPAYFPMELLQDSYQPKKTKRVRRVMKKDLKDLSKLVGGEEEVQEGEEEESEELVEVEEFVEEELGADDYVMMQQVDDDDDMDTEDYLGGMGAGGDEGGTM
jgi:hypothetical protein